LTGASKIELSLLGTRTKAYCYDIPNGVMIIYKWRVYASTTIYDYATYGMAGYSDLMYNSGNSVSHCTNTDISIIKAYNKELTATEVPQNFNATKIKIWVIIHNLCTPFSFGTLILFTIWTFQYIIVSMCYDHNNMV
jgi:hypothetical protein